MRKNTKVSKKMSVMAAVTMRFGAIIVFFFVMVILYLMSSSTCRRLSQNIGDLEKQIKELENARNDEATKWQRLLTDENILAELKRRCIEMKPAKVDRQVIRMTPDGQICPGQPSVATIRRRFRGVGIAAADEVPARRGSTPSRYPRRKVRQ